MSMTTTPLRVEGESVVAVRAPTLGWALRRTLLAIVILFISVAGAACLLYASIDPEEEAVSAATSLGRPDLAPAIHDARRGLPTAGQDI